MKVTLLASTPNPLAVTEQAAAVCYDSTPTTDGRLTRQCYLSGHHTVLEPVSFTFLIENVSRACMAQLTRYRLASFNVQSQRYCDMKNAKFTVPTTLNTNPQAMLSYLDTLGYCSRTYEALQQAGIPNEDARFILPNACSTNIVMTMNLRELIHACNQRLCARAQWEIRSLFKLIVNEVNAATNGVFSYMLVPECEKKPGYPVCPESKKQTCGKHPRLAKLYEWYNLFHGKEKK